MRPRPLTVPAVLLAAALSLAGCSSAGEEATAAATGTASAVEAGSDGPFPTTGDVIGETPELTFPDADPSTALQVQVLTAGAGDVVEAGDLLVADYLGQVWGGDVFDSSFDGSPAAFSIGIGAVIEGWDAGLVGQSVGSRVVLSIPPDLGCGSAGNEGAGIAGTDTLVFVVDILGSHGAADAGSPDATETGASAGPVVTGALGEAAAVSVPEGIAAPTELRTTVLATADGDPVVAGGIAVQYAVSVWDNSGTGSTWDAGSPEAVGVGGGGDFDSLVGVPVGSHVVLEFPATDAESPAIAAVVDILAQISTG